MPEKLKEVPKKAIIIPPEEPGNKDVVHLDESLTSFTEADWIGVIVDSSSMKKPEKPTKSEKVTGVVFKSYPYADVYGSGGGARSLGSVILKKPLDKDSRIITTSQPSHRYVATLITQLDSGYP